MFGDTKRVRIKNNCFVSIGPHIYAPVKLQRSSVAHGEGSTI